MRAFLVVATLLVGTISYGQAYQVREIIDSKNNEKEYPQAFEIKIDQHHVEVGENQFAIMYEEDLTTDASEALKGKSYKLFQTRNMNNYVLEVEHRDYEVYVTLYEHEGDRLIGSKLMKAVNF